MTAPTTGTALNTSELRAMVAGMRGPWQTAKGAVVWVNRWQIATFENPSDGQLAAAAVNNLEALLDAADERDDLLSKVERLEAVIAALAEKTPEQRLLEAIFGTAGCRCGCGSPRWDQDRIVLEHGWNTPDRCGRCGELQPEDRAALTTDTTTEDS